MRNILLAWKNLSDEGTVSGGVWESALPSSAVQVESLSTVARTSGIATNITQLTVDLARGQLVHFVGIIAHSLSVEATVRITGSQDVNFLTLVYDSGWMQAVPRVWGNGNGGLWGVDSVWTGRYAESDLEGMTRNFFNVPSSPVVARYWKIEMNDPTNSKGYIDIGRVFIGPAWIPTNNYNVGAAMGWIDKSVVGEGLGGALFVEPRTKKRRFTFDLDFLGKDEAMAQAFEMQRRQGNTGQVVVIPFPDEPRHQFRESFIGRLRELKPLEIRQAGLHDIGYVIEEVVA